MNLDAFNFTPDVFYRDAAKQLGTGAGGVGVDPPTNCFRSSLKLRRDEAARQVMSVTEEFLMFATANPSTGGFDV